MNRKKDDKPEKNLPIIEGSSNMINFYKTKRIKKFLDNAVNPNFHQTEIPYNTRILVSGASGTGKSLITSNLVFLSPGSYSRVIVCIKEEKEPLYELLQDRCKCIEFINNPNKLPPLNQETKQELKGSNCLVIIDDFVMESRKFEIINEWFLKCRKFNMTVCFLTQSYYDTDKFIRQQCEYVFLLAMANPRDISAVLSEMSSPLIDKCALKQMYFDSITNEFNFLKVKLKENRDITKRYTRNFIDRFDFAKYKRITNKCKQNEKNDYYEEDEDEDNFDFDIGNIKLKNLQTNKKKRK